MNALIAAYSKTKTGVHETRSTIKKLCEVRGFELDLFDGEHFVGACLRTPGAPLRPAVDGIRSDDGKIALVEGRIDLINGMDLEPTLANSAQGVMAGWSQFGQELADPIRGDFAIVIFEPERHGVHIIRDPMGVRPIYYINGEDDFLVSTDLGLLRSIVGGKWDLNPTRIAEHILCVQSEREATFYAGIKRLPPAHYLDLVGKKLSIKHYWAPDVKKELKLATTQDYVEAFRECFEEAVRRRMPQAGKVGSFLSGGMDSSSIACTARHILQKQNDPRLVHTFSATFGSLSPEELKAIDEREYQDSVNALSGVESHEFKADECDPLEDLNQLIKVFDEPPLAPNLYIHRGIMQQAQALGIEVLLDGIDGDTTITYGFGWLQELTEKGRWLRLWQENRKLLRRVDGRSRSTRWWVKEFWLKPILKKFRRDQRADFPLPDLLSPQLKVDLNYEKWCEERTQEWDRKHPSARVAHSVDFAGELHPRALEALAAIGRETHTECLFPFFDRDLIELCVSLPHDLKLRDGWTRWILREAMTNILPDKNRVRLHKSRLGANFLQFMQIRCQENILKSKTTNEKEFELLIDTGTITDMAQAVRAGAVGREALYVYSAITLRQWLRTCHKPS